MYQTERIMQKTLKEMLLEIFLVALAFSCKCLLAYFCQALSQYLHFDK